MQDQTDETARLIRRIADHEDIRQCMMRYARAIDRVDEALLRSVYWPGAIDNHGSYNGDVEGFVTWVIPLLGTMEQTMHFMGNILIEVNGDQAATESYFTAFHRVVGADGKAKEITVAGRYIDKMERRNGEWRVSIRNVAYDWVAENNAPVDWSSRPLNLDYQQNRFPNDPSYALFGN